MTLISRARDIYKQDGLNELIVRSKIYVISDVFPKIIWSVLPEAKTKRTIADSKVLTTLYYFIQGSFYDEQRALLYGQAIYMENEVKKSNPSYSVIRNTHRIEKGLSMEDRRDVFAEDYIEDLIESLERIIHKSNTINNNQLKWALDVLDEYFRVVNHTDPIERAYRSYLDLLEEFDHEPGNKRPFFYGDLHQPSLDYNSFRELAERRHSTRWFKEKKVDRELIDKAISVAVESPSACNRQSFQFFVFDNEEMIADLADIPGGAKSYKDNIPCLVILVGKQRAYFHNRDKHVIYIDASLAAMTFQYALESLGLGSCCINWQSISRNQRKIRNKLDLDNDEKVIMYMAVGYPDSEAYVPYSEKKEINNILSYNFGDN